MELKDLIITPLYFLLIIIAAYWMRPLVTDSVTRQYFYPALILRLIGAIMLGVIYQFYYHGGDTFNFHSHGSRHLWSALIDSPVSGIKLFFANGEIPEGTFAYASKIYFIRDPASYTVIQIATFFDLLTFSTYSATALLFAVFSFIGAWMFFLTFYRLYPGLHRQFAIASFFIPSVFFWGSGILKDTIVIACLGCATYFIYELFIMRRFSISRPIFLFMTLFIIYGVKKFVLQAFLPAVLVWIMAENFSLTRSVVLKIMLMPFLVAIMTVSAYFAVVKVGENDKKYSLTRIAETARVTAYDIRYWTGRDAGSGYSLGELDGTFGSILRLSPAAINVALYRPYLWEVRNPLMAIAAIESVCLLVATFLILYKVKFKLFRSLTNPDVLFCLIFSLTYALAVGVSTFNFGSLARYKIPLMPFFVVALVIMYHEGKKLVAQSEENIER